METYTVRLSWARCLAFSSSSEAWWVVNFLCFACCLSPHVLVKVFFGAISLSQLYWSRTLTVTFVLAGKLWEPVHFFKPGSNVLLELRLLSHGHNVNRWCMWLESKITQIACQCSWLRGHRVSDKDGTCSSTPLSTRWLGKIFCSWWWSYLAFFELGELPS